MANSLRRKNRKGLMKPLYNETLKKSMIFTERLKEVDTFLPNLSQIPTWGKG